MASIILAVDDSPSMREMIAFLLHAAGYDVLEAGDGAQALKIARSQHLDMILTDQNMPKVDGLALVRELRAMPAYRDTPIVILSTETSAEMKRKGREAGATAWISKPFDPDKLLTLLTTVLVLKPVQGL